MTVLEGLKHELSCYERGLKNAKDDIIEAKARVASCEEKIAEHKVAIETLIEAGL